MSALLPSMNVQTVLGRPKVGRSNLQHCSTTSRGSRERLPPPLRGSSIAASARPFYYCSSRYGELSPHLRVIRGSS